MAFRTSINAGLTLAGAALPMLLSSLGTSIANAALPALAAAFGAPFAAAQWIAISYLLAITLLVVVMGRLGDRFGRKRLLLAGIALFTLASLACGLAPSLGWLVASRAVQGVGAATMLSLSLAVAMDSMPAGRVGGAMGLLGATSAIGTALGPMLGGLLVTWPGWPAIFLLNIPLGMIAFELGRRMLANDAPGATGEPAPLVPVAMPRDPALCASLAANVLVSAALMTTLVVGPFYLTYGLGLDAAQVGAILSIGPAVVAISGVPAGRIADRVGAVPTSLAGLGILTAGCAALGLLPPAATLPGYVASVVLITSGYSLFQTANSAAIMTRGARQFRGSVAGLLTLSRNLGLVIGASAMAALFSLGAGADDMAAAPPDSLAAGLSLTFGCATLMLMVSLSVMAVATRGRALAPQ